MRLFMYKKFGHIFVSLQKLAQALLLPLVFVQVIIVLEWLSTYVGSINLFVWKLGKVLFFINLYNFKD